MDLEKLRNKFIEKVSQGVIFYKTPFLPSEVNEIFEALEFKERCKRQNILGDKDG